MADEQDVLLEDGTTAFQGGQDASSIPSKVSNEAFFAGVNLSLTNGIPQPRWGQHKRNLQFPDGGITDPISHATLSYDEIFHSGRYQAIIPYTIGNINYLIIIVSGVLFLTNIDTYVVSIITIQGGGSINQYQPRVNWTVADKYLVIFDFPNLPVIFDGITAKRSDPALYEVPVSVLGVYNQNRLFISNAGNEYTAGDPTGDLATPFAPVSFTEVLFPSAPYFGQVFKIPSNYLNNNQDPITAMVTLQLVDTSTGIGPLIISTKNAIYTAATNTPRANWDVSTFATMFVDSSGIVGPRAVDNVNSDLFYLSSDGQVRSASMSRDEQHKWARIPVSREVQNWLKYQDIELAKYGTVKYFNNKIFITANPFITGALDTNRKNIYDLAFGGLVVIALDDLAKLGRDGVPSWDGLWTGARPMDMIVQNKRMFVMSKDPDFRNELYEFDPATTYDTDDQTIRQVRTIVYTKSYDCKSPFQSKMFHSLDVDIQRVRGDFNMTVEFLPSQASIFATWGVFKHNAPWRICSPNATCLNGLNPHNFRNLTFGTPLGNNACDQVARITYDVFRKVQLKFTIEGIFWQLEGYRLKATPVPQSELETTCDKTYYPVEICKTCNTDWEVKPFKSCQSLMT